MDTKTIDKKEIAAQLRKMTEERLFGGKPWPIDDNGDNGEVHRKFVEWELIKEIDEVGTCTTTALGRELSVGCWSALMGHHDLPEVPHILVEYGLLTQEEADHIIFDRWERADEKLEDILPPILRRAYRARQQ